MKKAIIFFLMLVLFGTSSKAQQKQISQLALAVESLRAAMVDPSKQKLEALVMDSLSYGHSSGLIEGKKEFISKLVDGRSDFVSIDLTDQTIKLFGNTGIVRHLFTAVTNDNNKTSTIKILVLLVWVKDHGVWKLAARQAVKAGV